MKLTKRQKSKIQEAKTAKDVGGRTTIASGALVQKSDVVSSVFQIECKTTEKPYYRLTKNVWNKIVKEARNNNLRLPVMRIDINDTNSNPLSYAIMREQDFTHSCFEHFVYALQVKEEPYENSFKVEKRPINLVNAYVICGLHFELDSSGLVQIDWGDFVRLVKEIETDGT